MKSRVAPLILLFGAALASSKTNSKCSKDGCARALTGTRLGTNHPSIAKADCSSFFQKITTPTITVVVTNTVATATTLIPAKRQLPTPGIPFYARVCTEPGSYASACSCLGVSQCTSAASPTTITITANVTATVTEKSTSSTTSSSVSASSSCTNTVTDPLNCGTCGNICSSGICENGSCSITSCIAKTCGHFQNCSVDDNCFCFSSARDPPDNGFCGANALCDSSTPCTTDADCVPGSSGNICAVNTCCSQPADPQPGICLQASCGNPMLKLKMMARAGSAGTAAH